jgi:hypothetical protein
MAGLSLAEPFGLALAEPGQAVQSGFCGVAGILYIR